MLDETGAAVLDLHRAVQRRTLEVHVGEHDSLGRLVEGQAQVEGDRRFAFALHGAGHEQRAQAIRPRAELDRDGERPEPLGEHQVLAGLGALRVVYTDKAGSPCAKPDDRGQHGEAGQRLDVVLRLHAPVEPLDDAGDGDAGGDGQRESEAEECQTLLIR